MSLSAELSRAARACQGAADALSHSLRPGSSTTQLSAIQMDTFREAEAFSITIRTVMDKLEPTMSLLECGAACVGKQEGLTHGSSLVCNGIDTLVSILVSLFNTSNNAILDAANVRSRSLLQPLNVASCFEKMVTHHGQLRAMYGIIHLMSKITEHVDVSQTLFLPVSDGAEADRDFQPAKFRAAIKLDDFYGRGFGFHYTAEMRNVLRVVNIARGSVHKSHVDHDPSPQFVKNVFMLGWGWVYSNMVLMDNIGFSIDGVSRIGVDDNEMSIVTLRKFMNLVEEPLVAGVTNFVSADVAMDSMFAIPQPGAEEGMEPVDSPWHSERLRDVFRTIDSPVRARLMSYKNRPTALPAKKHSAGTLKKQQSMSAVANTSKSTQSLSAESASGRSSGAGAPSASRARTEPIDDHNARAFNEAVRSNGVGNQEALVTRTSSAWSEVVDRSYLASAFKSSVTSIHSNMSSFLGIEEAKPAVGLIVHFHGGGFVSQSTSSHQGFMKEICADIPDSVLFSVEYRLAPEHKFPVALHECTYAYLWALQNANRLGTLAERVVFVGDSAGGNLAVAVALLVGELGVRPPDAVCVAYPALHINSAWSPSRLLSFFDPMLPLSVLELCLKSYVGEHDDNCANPLVSPTLAPDEQLRCLPPITLLCGSLDPLLDDSALFAHRLRNAGRTEDCFKVCESMPHGFMNMIQVSVTARSALHFLAKRISDALQVPLSKRTGLVDVEANGKNRGSAEVENSTSSREHERGS
ncbi:hormone-sensitive lipase [Gracilaria domingensis]|nr:hormone-sensitive lipase [Gracilaria domingensis]